MTFIDYLWAAASIMLAIPLMIGTLAIVIGALYMSDKEKMEAQHAEG